jgi:hypothetical protein
MSDTIHKAAFQDALAIESGKIMVDGVEWGFVTGLTVDWKSPEDLINCISWTLRRRKPMTTEWTVDAAVLYNNIKDLARLKGGLLFQIVVTFVNPDTTNPDNLGQELTLNECRIQDHSINLTDNSTFKMSGRAKSWSVEEATTL